MTDYLSADPFTGQKYSGVRKNAAKHFSKRTDWHGKKVVDLSCGDGVTTYILRKLGATVTPYELNTAYCKLEDAPLFANVQKELPIASESVDLVVLQEVIEHLPNQLFTIQEIYRILKPGGELFLTTPSKSSLQARLSFLVFESEHLRSTPWGALDGVWGQNENGEKYFGHLWLIGIQQLSAFGKIAGFKKTEVHLTEFSKTSMWLMPFFYPFIYLLSRRALYRDLRHRKNDSNYMLEKNEQFRLNVSPKTLLSKYSFVSLYK
ncbi:MAG: class I SAM-dependent methyltransferase [Betaproteobacteria bacterium]|nr:class I SAM-dependent methyltransferase [Betaproteobacteria bacterium]